MTDTDFEIYAGDPALFDYYMNGPAAYSLPSGTFRKSEPTKLRNWLGSNTMTLDDFRPTAEMTAQVSKITGLPSDISADYLRSDRGLASLGKTSYVNREIASQSKTSPTGTEVSYEPLETSDTDTSNYDIAENVLDGLGTVADIYAQNRNDKAAGNFTMAEAKRKAEMIMRDHDFQRAADIQAVSGSGLASGQDTFEEGTGVSTILESNLNTALQESKDVVEQARKRQAEINRRNKRRGIGAAIGTLGGAFVGFKLGGLKGAAVGASKGAKLGSSF